MEIIALSAKALWPSSHSLEHSAGGAGGGLGGLQSRALLGLTAPWPSPPGYSDEYKQAACGRYAHMFDRGGGNDCVGFEM